MNHDLIGVVAGVISFAAYALYILTTLFPKKFFGQETKPNRATWFVLTLIGAVIAESYYSSGARASIWVAVSYFIGPLIIALISLNKKYGVGGWEGFDKYCLVAAVATIVLRVMYRNHPTVSLVLGLATDFLALIPTIKKSYSMPKSEDKIAWTLECIACATNLVAIERWQFSLWVYPVYLLMINGVVLALLVRNSQCRKIIGFVACSFR